MEPAEGSSRPAVGSRRAVRSRPAHRLEVAQTPTTNPLGAFLMRVLVRLLVLFVVLAVGAAGTLFVRDAVVGSTGVKTIVTLDDVSTTVMPGERFSVSGEVSTRATRPVVLQRRDPAADRWEPVTQVRTEREGRFVFEDVTARLSDELRISVPGADTGDQTLLPASVLLPSVQVVEQRTDPLDLLPPIVQPGVLPAGADDAQLVGTTRFHPARPGRPVLVQRRQQTDPWVTVARTEEGPRGEVRFEAAAPMGDGVEYRLVARPYAGARRHITAPVATDDWALKFDDEFSLGYLEPVWATRGDVHAPESSRTCARADTSMAQVSGGVLSLQVAPDPALAGTTCEWHNDVSGKSGKSEYVLNAQVSTERRYAFRYGTAAARVRFQQPRGMHGSFWMQDSGEPFGTRGAEIDTVEFFGEGYPDGGLAAFVHLPTGEKIGGLQPTASDALDGRGDAWWRRYHVFSVEWSPEAYIFRVDGEEIYRTAREVADRKVFLILSLLTSDWELDDLPESSTGSADVDWVRVWQHTSLADQNL